MTLAEAEAHQRRVNGGPVNWCVFGIDDEFRMWVPRARCVDKLFVMEHRFICGKCGGGHSRFRDRAKTRQAGYCLACHAERMRATRPKFSELSDTAKMKAEARRYANVYKRRGQLVPTPCEKCGSPDVEMHHEDYTKPLEVRWLCRMCHLTEHTNEEAAEAV